MLQVMLNSMITSMIFFPEKTFYEKPEDYGFDAEDIRFKTSDGVELHGWFLGAKSPEKGTLLFFHGNAGNISHRLYKVKGWVERGFSVFLIDYRGYGKSQGEIKSDADVIRDGEAALSWLTEKKKISLARLIFYGESLGTYPAIYLGAQHKVLAVVLEAPFTSFLDLARLHYPIAPAMLMKGLEFSNQDWISKLKSPLFILHGSRDEICPYAMSGELFEKAPEPKGFLSIPNGMHNDLPNAAGEDYWEKPYQFVSQYLVK